MNLKTICIALFFICLNNSACAQNNTNEESTVISSAQAEEALTTTIEKASVINVSVSGNENNYNFNVSIASPDSGCNQYANWWEVLTKDGTLIYRRILGHSHVNEQPFTRSGGTVAILANQIVYIRAHMNTSGYGTNAYKGSVATGFSQDTLATDFANN